MKEKNSTMRSAVREFESGSIFRTIHFPKNVDPDRAKGEFRDGILNLRVPIALAAQPQKTKHSKQRAASARPKA
jgi:HSP20 family molecular chaperone IbpA